jgi:hypothetical protein
MKSALNIREFGSRNHARFPTINALIRSTETTVLLLHSRIREFTLTKIDQDEQPDFA